jgi:hypothetical protein
MGKRGDDTTDDTTQNVLGIHVIEFKQGAKNNVVFIGGLGLVSR